MEEKKKTKMKENRANSITNQEEKNTIKNDHMENIQEVEDNKKTFETNVYKLFFENKFPSFQIKRNKVADFFTSMNLYLGNYFRTLGAIKSNSKRIKSIKKKSQLAQKSTNAFEINYKPIDHAVVSNDIDQKNDSVAIPSTVFEAENKKYDVFNQDIKRDFVALAHKYELDKVTGLSVSKVKAFEDIKIENTSLDSELENPDQQQDKDNNLPILDNEQNALALKDNSTSITPFQNNVFNSLVPMNNSLVQFVEKKKNKLWWKWLVLLGSLGLAAAIATPVGYGVKYLVEVKHKTDRLNSAKRYLNSFIIEANKFVTQIKSSNRAKRDKEILVEIESAIKSAQLKEKTDTTSAAFFENVANDLNTILEQQKKLQKNKINIEEDLKSILNGLEKINKDYGETSEKVAIYNDILRGTAEFINDNYYLIKLDNYFDLQGLQNHKKRLNSFYVEIDDKIRNRENAIYKLNSFIPQIENKENIFPSDVFKNYYYNNITNQLKFSTAEEKHFKDHKITYSVSLNPNDILGYIECYITYYIHINGLKQDTLNPSTIKITKMKKAEFIESKKPKLKPKNNFQFTKNNFEAFKKKLAQEVEENNFNTLKSIIDIQHPSTDVQYKVIFDRNSYSYEADKKNLTIKYRLSQEVIYSFENNLLMKKPIKDSEKSEILSFIELIEYNTEIEKIRETSNKINTANEKFKKEILEFLNYDSELYYVDKTLELYEQISFNLNELIKKYKDKTIQEDEFENNANDLLNEIHTKSIAIKKDVADIRNKKVSLNELIDSVHGYINTYIDVYYSNQHKNKEAVAMVVKAKKALVSSYSTLDTLNAIYTELETYFIALKKWNENKRKAMNSLKDKIKTFREWKLAHISTEINSEFNNESNGLISLYTFNLEEIYAETIDIQNGMAEFEAKSNEIKNKLQEKEEKKLSLELFIKNKRQEVVEKYVIWSFYQENVAKIQISISYAEGILKNIKSITKNLEDAINELTQKWNEFITNINTIDDGKFNALSSRYNDIEVEFNNLLQKYKNQDLIDIVNPYIHETEDIKDLINKHNGNANKYHDSLEKLNKTYDKYKEKLKIKNGKRTQINDLTQECKTKIKEAIKNPDHATFEDQWNAIIFEAENILKSNIYVSLDKINLNINQLENIKNQLIGLGY